MFHKKYELKLNGKQSAQESASGETANAGNTDNMSVEDANTSILESETLKALICLLYCRYSTLCPSFSPAEGALLPRGDKSASVINYTGTRKKVRLQSRTLPLQGSQNNQ